MKSKLNQPLPLAATAAKPPAPPVRAPLSLHIERLVLNGLSVTAAERSQLQAAVVAELQTLFASGALSPQLHGAAALQHLRLDDIRLHRGAGAEQIGVQIARALHGGIGE